MENKTNLSATQIASLLLPLNNQPSINAVRNLYCGIIPSNQMIEVGFGKLCRAPTANEFLKWAEVK